jgi:hypothetical protein
MLNRRMAEKLLASEAIDVSKCPRNSNGDFILTAFQEDVDYCDAEREEWIWSIGRDRKSGEILASTSGKFYQNPSYECLFLR